VACAGIVHTDPACTQHTNLDSQLHLPSSCSRAQAVLSTAPLPNLFSSLSARPALAAEEVTARIAQLQAARRLLNIQKAMAALHADEDFQADIAQVGLSDSLLCMYYSTLGTCAALHADEDFQGGIALVGLSCLAHGCKLFADEAPAPLHCRGFAALPGQEESRAAATLRSRSAARAATPPFSFHHILPCLCSRECGRPSMPSGPTPCNIEPQVPHHTLHLCSRECGRLSMPSGPTPANTSTMRPTHKSWRCCR